MLAIILFFAAIDPATGREQVRSPEIEINGDLSEIAENLRKIVKHTELMIDILDCQFELDHKAYHKRFEDEECHYDSSKAFRLKE